MKLAIKGHLKRGNEVIERLEMLGGINKLDLKGTEDYTYYYIDDSSNNIYCVLSVDPNDYNVYTLEEFLEKFPYKVGDKVQHKGATSCGSIFEVEDMRWEEDTVKYTLCLFGCNYKRSTLPAEYLQPYKEETMEEKLEQITFDIPDGYEFFGINDDNQVVLAKKQPQYPKTYEECSLINGAENRIPLRIIGEFTRLINARNAYWKIAGEQMGLDKPWKPNWEDNYIKYIIAVVENEICKDISSLFNYVLVFPTEEMRDTFYENFKELIEQCKELL